MIHAFDTTLPIHFYCDAATSRGLGFILLQPTNKKDAPFNFIKCGSTHLLQTQKRYSTYQIKLLAVLFLLEKTRHYCLGAPQQIQIFSDHLCLRNIQDKDFDRITSTREIRMLGKMIPYNYQIHHIPARKNIIADLLSQYPVEHYDFGQLLGDEFSHKINVIAPIRANLGDLPLNIQMMIKESITDKKFQDLIDVIKNKQPLP